MTRVPSPYPISNIKSFWHKRDLFLRPDQRLKLGMDSHKNQPKKCKVFNSLQFQGHSPCFFLTSFQLIIQRVHFEQHKKVHFEQHTKNGVRHGTYRGRTPVFPVPDTSVSSVRHQCRYRTLRSVSSVRYGYRYRYRLSYRCRKLR